MIVEQYKPQEPQIGNELHAIQLMRIQARKEADIAYDQLNKNVHNLFKPSPSRGLIGMLGNNISMIVAGISIGKKIIKAIRK